MMPKYEAGCFHGFPIFQNQDCLRELALPTKRLHDPKRLQQKGAFEKVKKEKVGHLQGTIVDAFDTLLMHEALKY